MGHQNSKGSHTLLLYSGNNDIIDSIMGMDKKHFPQTYLKERKYTVKKNKISSFIDTELQLDGSGNSDSSNSE